MDLGVGRHLSYSAARRLLLVTGLVVLGVTAVTLYVRRVEAIEVLAVLLFVPIYVAVVAGRVSGGVIAAVVACGAYGALRFAGVDTFDTGDQVKLVAARSAAYLVFGLVGGLAVKQLEASLVKLDRYDLVDDDTGLFNARFLANELDLESARAKRYGSVFSVVVVQAPTAPLEALRRSPRTQALRALGTTVGERVRLVDRAAIGQQGDTYRVAIVLPETPAAGAQVLAERLGEALEVALDEAGALTGEAIVASSYTFPEHEAEIAQLRTDFAAMERSQHPTSPPR